MNEDQDNQPKDQNPLDDISVNSEPKDKPDQPTVESTNTDEPKIEEVKEVQPTKKSFSKMMWVWISLATLLSLFLIWFFFLKSDNAEVVTNTQEEPISSFEECVTAGHPVMETYPEQCAVPGGETFTRVLTEEEQAALDAANEPEPEEEVEEVEEVPDFGKITILSVMDADLHDYTTDVEEDTKVIEVKIRIENTSNVKRGYDIYSFSAEDSTGEIIEALEVDEENGLFYDITLAPKGLKEVTLLFDSDTFLKKLYWNPSEDYETDEQVFPVN